MSAHVLYFLKLTIFDRTESRCQALARQHRHHTRWNLPLLIIKQANQMDVIPCFFSSNVSNKNCWPSNRRSGLSTYTSGDLRVLGQTAQVLQILIIWQGHDVFGGLRRDSSEITFRYSFMDSSSKMVLVLVTSGAIMVVLDYAYIPIPQKSLYGLNPKASFQMLYIWYSSSFPLLRYSSYQIMRERLLQVLTASLDPLSGWWA